MYRGLEGDPVPALVLGPVERRIRTRQHHFRVEYSSLASIAGGRLLYLALGGALVAALAMTLFYIWRVVGV